MSQSKTNTKKHQNEDMSEAKFREILAHWNLECVDLNFAENEDKDDIPYVVLDVSEIFGFEVHLFTAADMALWVPELLPSGNVVIYYPNRHQPECSCTLAQIRLNLWDRLARFIDWVIHKVRTGRTEYGLPSTSWAHSEREEDGYYEIPEDTPQYIEKILRRVDDYLPDVMLELNKNGFVTIESCSGLEEDHDDRTPSSAFVCFSDEYYLDVSAHLFTLAEASGWDPDFGAHGFHVFFHPHGETQEEIKQAWERLADMVGDFGEYLEDYRDLVDPWYGYYYYQFRNRRGFFSQCYNEENQTLSGINEELDTIDSEFYGQEDD